MSIQIEQMFTVKCDCCDKKYSNDEYDVHVWHDFDDAWAWASDDGWIERGAESEEDDLMHFCPDCFAIDEDDMVTTNNGITFQN